MKPRNKRKCLRTLALGLAVSLLTGMFSSAQTAAEMPLESAAEENILQNQELWSPVEDVQQLNTEGDMSLKELTTAQLPPEDIPEMVTDAQIAEKEHVNRLWEQEEDLNTVIFQNRDGSKTLYYFDYAVKYVDENGVVRDKKKLLSGDIAEPSLVEDYGYVNADNDIQTYFPKTLDRDNSVVLTYGEYRIEMAPMHRVKAPLMVAAGLQVAVRPGEQQTSGLREIMLEAQTAPAVKKQTDTGQTTERPSDVVEYAGIFGEGTLLRYTPTFEGYKEDLILAGPEAGNRFTFVVDAGGLQVVSENQAVYFLNPLTGEILATMDPLYVYDSFVGDSSVAV